MTTHCFTSASFSYLDRARVLARSVKRHHPEWVFWFLLSDVEPPGFRFIEENEPFDRVLRHEELNIDHVAAWTFKHDIVELCTAVKGPMLHRLLSLGAERVVYLDPDIALFGPLTELEELLALRSVVLTPHVTKPEDTLHGILDNEIGSLKHGIYNLGFVAVRNTEEGRRFGLWWNDRLIQFCYDDVPNGLFTDQRWCDLVPAIFDNVGILRHPGYNAASWNLGGRPVSIERDGALLAAEQPLRFFHFTKVNTVGEAMLERYAYGRGEPFDLLRWYRARLEEERAGGLPLGWWAYGRYADGTPVPKAHRVAWRVRTDLWSAIPNPLVAGSAIVAEALGL